MYSSFLMEHSLRCIYLGYCLDSGMGHSGMLYIRKSSRISRIRIGTFILLRYQQDRILSLLSCLLWWPLSSISRIYIRWMDIGYSLRRCLLCIFFRLFLSTILIRISHRKSLEKMSRIFLISRSTSLDICIFLFEEYLMDL